MKKAEFTVEEIKNLFETELLTDHSVRVEKIEDKTFEILSSKYNCVSNFSLNKIENAIKDRTGRVPVILFFYHINWKESKDHLGFRVVL